MAALLLGAAALAPGACAPDRRAPPPGPARLEGLQPFRLAVGGIEVEDAVQALPLNFIDRRRSEELIAATRQYVGDRLQAAGGADFGKVVVETASVVEQPRPPIGGVRGALTREPATDLVGTLAVRVAVTDGLGVERSYARGQVELKRAVPPGSTVLDRDRQARALSLDLLRQLDKSLDPAIRENLAAELVGS